MITQPHRSEEVVTIDRRTEQTMRAWMDDITDEVNSFISGYGLSGAYAYKTANYTAASNDYTIDCSGTFDVSLPTAAGIAGKIYNIKNSGAGVITVNPNGAETIDGGLTAVLSTTYESITIQSTGTNWIII